MNLSQLSESQRNRVETAIKNVPFAHLVGIELESAQPGQATMTLKVRDDLRQNNMVVHGGAVAALIDSAAAFAIIPLLNENETATTVDLSISYIRPLRNGEMKAIATVLREGSRIIAVSVEVLDDESNLAAAGLTTYLRLQKPTGKSS